jgi:hypothetical protein
MRRKMKWVPLKRDYIIRKRDSKLDPLFFKEMKIFSFHMITENHAIQTRMIADVCDFSHWSIERRPIILLLRHTLDYTSE